jgi:hypothetical protein
VTVSTRVRATPGCGLPKRRPATPRARVPLSTACGPWRYAVSRHGPAMTAASAGDLGVVGLRGDGSVHFWGACHQATQSGAVCGHHQTAATTLQSRPSPLPPPVRRPNCSPCRRRPSCSAPRWRRSGTGVTSGRARAASVSVAAFFTAVTTCRRGSTRSGTAAAGEERPAGG